jgi:hypothetical protein
MRQLDVIVIPTGTSEEDLDRVDVALNHGSSKTHYIVSGLGPDTNLALERQRKGESTDELDFHRGLWNYLKHKYEQGEIGIFGVDTSSLNSKENLVNTFPSDTSGKYGIVSYPLHLVRFRILENRLKSEGHLSQDLTLEGISTPQSLRQLCYGILALGKELIRH